MYRVVCSVGECTLEVQIFLVIKIDQFETKKVTCIVRH